MASTYTTEPPATATVVVHTTAGPLTISLFAQQTPLTCRNFMQLCLDGYYDNCSFHRISPGFVIQTGDPTGTGEGGQNIYEDAENEYLDDKWARVLGKEKGDKVVFGNELHSRLKFNRRGLVGMAKTDGADKHGGYGSQFFITLGDCRRELDGHCTLFGRVEGDGIYNVVRIAEGELVEGTERPLYPDKIVRTEVVEMPRGEAWEAIKRRETVAQRQPVDSGSKHKKKDKAKKKKAVGKQMLSFDDGGEDGSDSAVPVRPKKAKFNTALVADQDGDHNDNNDSNKKKKSPDWVVDNKPKPAPSVAPAKRKLPTPSPGHRRTPSFPEPTSQLPLPDQQSPSRSPSPTPPPKSKSAALEAEIAALKQSLRRSSPTRTHSTSTRQKSALEAMIPETSTRGRKRPRAGGNYTNAKADANAIKMLNAFRQRLDKASSTRSTSATTGKPTGSTTNGSHGASGSPKPEADNEADGNDDEETPLCDLHFIANCQSCASWDKKKRGKGEEKKTGQDKDEVDEDGNDNDDNDDDDDDDDDRTFLSHALKFTKDTLGKDLEWRKRDRNREYDDGLMVIDPREKEREIATADKKGKNRRA